MLRCLVVLWQRLPGLIAVCRIGSVAVSSWCVCVVLFEVCVIIVREVLISVRLSVGRLVCLTTL